MKRHKNITVAGKVQGVFYRVSALDKARELGLTGWVMNLPNGNVYLEVEGEDIIIQELIIWCHEGPHLAKVDSVSVEDAELQDFTEFKIRR